MILSEVCFFFSSRRRHTISKRDWSSDVCSSDLTPSPRKRGRVMAIYHFDVKPVQRSKGHSAVAKAAERSGTRLYGWRTMQAHNFCRKHRVVLSAILAPSHAPEWVYDREELWNRAEAAETRRNAQPAREIRLGLPHEL